MKFQKYVPAFKALAAVAFLGVAALNTVQAQPYETSLTTSNLTENFDELGISSIATLPAGWVFAQGLTLPIYDGPPVCPVIPVTFFGASTNCQTCTRDYDGGGSGGSGNTATPTGGGRVNYGDATSVNRAIGFMSLNSSLTTSQFECPTNFIMFGFTNNTGSNIISLAVTNNIKMFRESSSTAFQTAVTFYYSSDGTNWTHLSSGDVGPFPSGTTTYFFSAPIVSNVSLTINSLNISNNAPFYLAWRFVIANSSGSFSAGLALDDVGLTATFGAPSANSVWTAGSGNWSTASDWLGSTLPISGNNLIFAGAGGSSANNLAAVSTGTGSIGWLNFSNTAGSYTFTGNAVTLAGGVTNNSTATQTINLPLTLQMDEAFSAASGNMIYGTGITNGGFGVTFAGASNSTLNGSVTGGGSMNMSGTGLLLLNTANTYSGVTTINSGTLRLGASELIPDGSSVSMATGATFDLNNFGETIGNLNGGGNVTLGSATLILGLNNAAATFGGVISGNGGLTKNGTGVQTISATNTYHGTTLLNSGTLAIANVATLGDGPLVLAGGTFQLTGTRDTTNGILTNEFVLSNSTIVQNSTSATAGTRNLPFGGAVVATNGTLTIQNIATGNFTNVMNLRVHGTVTNFTQPIVFDNSLALSQVNNTCQLSSWNTNGTTDQLFSGVISGPGQYFRDALAPGTGGRTILTGNNTYTLGTVVVRGYLGIGADSVSSDGAVVSGPLGTSTLTIDDDTIGGLPNDGIYAYGGAHTIGNRIVLNGVTNTAIVGTNALTLAGVFDVGLSSKTLTLSNTALTTISGVLTNTGSLTLVGPGTLALTADSTTTWLGGMTIASGTVLANNSSGSATGTNPVIVTGGTLAGTGSVAGAVTAGTGGNVAPGNTIGILTLQNGLDLSSGGALVWTLGANSTASPGVNFSQLALSGGALNESGSSVLNLQFTGSATAPNSNTVFWQSAHSWRIVTLSGAASITGSTFSSIVNGSSAAGTFSTANDASGVLLNFTPGAAAPSRPKITSFSVQGGQIVFSGTNGTVSGGYTVLTTTNVTQPGTNWVTNTTATFGANGGFTNHVTINPGEPARFFRIRIP